jgi:hypothetical protein
MEERFFPAAAAEARPIDADGPEGGSAAPNGQSPPVAIDDPRALQILTTEHWSLLTARSLVYNETFARGGMFLAFLSASMLVLGLISTATGFSDAFLSLAAVLLALDLFVGLASLGRMLGAGDEDIRSLQAMNRLRHAYHEMVPGLEPYFSTSHHDDFDSVLMQYGPVTISKTRQMAHGFTTMPGMVSVICSAVTGGLVGVLAFLATHQALIAGIAGVLAFALAAVGGMYFGFREVMRFGLTFESRFPAPGAGSPPGAGQAGVQPDSRSPRED